jgi:hypothetical protein
VTRKSAPRSAAEALAVQGLSRVASRALVAIGLVAVVAGCVDPKDRRPGFALSGEVASALPADWSFTDAHREIAIEVSTPYWIPHSVTIWCVSVDGKLYVGARNPESKRWPGWADRDPNVRLKIGDSVYEVRLVPLADADAVGTVAGAIARKYELPATPPGEAPPIRFWRVVVRS